MARVEIDLRQRFFGDGYTDTISMPSSPAPAPALSWRDELALQQTASGAMASAVELRFLNLGMGRLLDAAFAIESTLGLHLAAQTRILDSQLDVLSRIESALLRPGQVSAAERIANTGELLRRGRYARALSDAELAIADDPNNPAGFVAAGWAATGLGRGKEARDFFREAGEAADGEERATALRQAARVAFAIEDGRAALRILAGCDGDLSPFQRAAVEYDTAVYLAASHDQTGAIAALRSSFEGDDRFASMVFADAILNKEPACCQAAAAFIEELATALANEQRQFDHALDAVETKLRECDLPVAGDIAAARDDLIKRIGDLRAAAAGGETTSLRVRLAALAPLRTRAAELGPEADDWRVAAEDTYDLERLRQKHLEHRREMDAQLALDLEAAARRFAADKDAAVTREPNGSWLITRQKAFGRTEAWKADTEMGTISIYSIIRRKRDSSL